MTLDYRPESATPFVPGFGLGREGGRRTFGRSACPPIYKEGSVSRRKKKTLSPLGSEAERKAARDDGMKAAEPTPEPPALLGRDAIRVAWEAAKDAE